jgi:hypothetical protein
VSRGTEGIGDNDFCPALDIFFMNGLDDLRVRKGGTAIPGINDLRNATALTLCAGRPVDQYALSGTDPIPNRLVTFGRHRLCFSFDVYRNFYG